MRTTTHRIVSALLLLAAGGIAPAQQAEEAARPEIGKPLQAAHELTKAGRFRDALDKIREAEAVPNPSSYERFVLDRMRGNAAAGVGDEATASRSWASALASGRLQPAEALQLLEALAGSAYRLKDYTTAIDRAKRYFEAGGKSEQVRRLKTASHFHSGDYAGVVNDMRHGQTAAEGPAPPADETMLRMLAASHAKLDDAAGYVATLEKLLVHHPKKEYWDDRLSRLQGAADFSDRLVLDVYRLRLATGAMDSAAQYVEMAQLALRAGLPFEATRITEAGHAAGKLGSGAEADRHRQLRDLAARQAAEDDKALSAEAAGRSGEAMVNTGFALVSAGRFDKGIALLEHGIASGDLKRLDKARLRLGQAYLQAGRTANAIEAFNAVRGSSAALADLARLWSIHARRT